jgi:hypothetical protein
MFYIDRKRGGRARGPFFKAQFLELIQLTSSPPLTHIPPFPRYGGGGNVEDAKIS